MERRESVIGFRQTLYRQAVYDCLPVWRRIRLHARIGAGVEARYGEQAVERAAELATHFEQGREYTKAVHYLKHAAERALQRYAYQEAIGLLGRGLTVLPKLPETPQRSRRAMDLAEELAQPWTLAMALGYAALVHVLRGDRQVALERAEATIQLATEQGGFSWIGRGIMLRGWALADHGQVTEGLAQMQRGFADWQANGQELRKTFWLALLAEGYARVGQVAEGQQVLAEASALAHTRELRVWEAELNRLWGELLLQQADQERDQSSAETYFRQALEIAFNQQAKSLELWAAISLSRLWQQQGKKNAARERLEKSYHWFTEGFDTADLQEAKALLDQLANSHGGQSPLPLGEGQGEGVR